MGKRVNPAFLLSAIKNECDEVIFTSSEYTTRATAQANALATLSLSSGDFTISTGDAGGDSEKITLAAKAVTWSGDGIVGHACLFRTSDSTHIVTTTAATNKQIYSGDDGNINAFDVWEIGAAS